jgi:hypothetical protein
MNAEQLVKREVARETGVLGETRPSATLSTINPTWLDMEPNPGRRSGCSMCFGILSLIVLSG